MPRPFCCRRITGQPAASIFKPIAVPVTALAEVQMTLDEFEALRLADLEGLYQTEAAHQMKVSRPTFSRIIDSAHRKVADALVHGKALRIEGGPVQKEAGECSRLHCGESLPDPFLPPVSESRKRRIGPAGNESLAELTVGKRTPEDHGDLLRQLSPENPTPQVEDQT